MSKTKIYKIESNSENGFDIGVPNDFPLGDEAELQKYPYIKYMPNMTIIKKRQPVVVSVLRFLVGSANLQNFVIKEINSWCSSSNDKQKKNIVSLLAEIERVFKTKKFDGTVEELLGDLGEIFFLYKMENMGINWTSFYQKDERTLYDAYFNLSGVYADVKTTTTGSKNMFIDLKQLLNQESRVSLFCCVCVEKIQGGWNIIELIKKLKWSSAVVEGIQQKWEERYAINKALICSYTVSNDNEIFFVDKSLIPKFKLIHKGGYVGGKVKILINDINKLDFKKTLLFLTH